MTRPMRRKEREMTDPHQIRAVLEKADYLVLAMNHPEAGPYAVALNYGFDDESIYVHCAPGGMKMEAMLADPRVSFSIVTDTALSEPSDPDNACGFGMRYRSLCGFGHVDIVEDDEGKRYGLERLMAHYSDRVYDFPESALKRTTILRIRVESLTGKQEGQD